MPRSSSTLDDPRVRFNWGYHDAASEVRRGKVRRLVEHGRQTPETVSREFDLNYYDGYVEGLRDARAAAYAGDSTGAWERTRAGNPRRGWRWSNPYGGAQ